MTKIEIDTSKPYFHRTVGCHGCAHEAADPCRERNEHRNSGETACMLCIRAPRNEVAQIMDSIITARGWSRLEFPKDMYVSIERLEFDSKFGKLKRVKKFPQFLQSRSKTN